MEKNKPFDKQFKQGDIICSDKFLYCNCMVVKEDNYGSLYGNFGYTCDDLIVENQRWMAYEFDLYRENPYNWRIATDEDIAAYLERYITTREENLNGVDVAITDDILTIDYLRGKLCLDMEQAAKLRDYLNKYVIGG